MAGLDVFSKIPQRLTAPFGLLPDAEKLAFRREPGGLQKLATVRVRVVFFLVIIAN